MLALQEMALLFEKSLETWPETALKESLELEKKGADIIVYFLCGSYVADEIHVAHIAKCPLPDTIDAEVTGSTGIHNLNNYDDLSKLLDLDWIVDHATKVLRMLPGGVTIVGITAICCKKVFTDQRLVLASALKKIQNRAAALSTLDLASFPSRMVLIHIDLTTKKMQTVITDVVHRGPDSPSQVKYAQLKWISLVTRVAVDIRQAIDVINEDDFYKEFTNAIKPWATSLHSSDTVYMFDDEFKDDAEALVKDPKKMKNSNSVEVFMYMASASSSEPKESAKIGEVFEVTFDLAVRATVPIKSNIAEAKRAINQHIIRQLMGRASLHYESMELQEEGRRASPALHQFPRAATTVIPSGGSLLVYDFLFEGDTADDAIKNFNALLSLKTSTVEEIDELWERNLNEGEKEEPSLIIQHAHKLPEPDNSLSFCLILFGIIFLIIAIVVVAVVSTTGGS
ncbi:odr-4 [Pristionchus pacificus]|uniref:Odr-4 n=1 Tax=Pristionchus pacificus TaxID=54126 RepID=A0A2A6BB51_PRIPA|nr:odr-4 [Pristionchus pacificus]|eukprot:PDM63112.1 odr-4 [Pristionchus pacificus]